LICLQLLRLRLFLARPITPSPKVGPLDGVRWGNLAKTLEHLDLAGNAKLGGRLEAVAPFDPKAPMAFKVSNLNCSRRARRCSWA
jgi:hypothetical protein